MTDAEKLAAIHALAAKVSWVAADQICNIIHDAKPYNPTEGMKRCGYRPPPHGNTCTG